jgi:copper chaperone CopZ
MTSHRYKRCIHCKIIYLWQSSGYGCQDQLCDAYYCEDCKLAVTNALKNIPVLFKSVWVDTDEISVKTLLDHREAIIEKDRSSGSVFAERVLAPLFDLEDPENNNANYEIKYNGNTYAVETWSKKPYRNKVKILMEEDLITGLRRPWRDV